MLNVLFHSFNTASLSFSSLSISVFSSDNLASDSCKVMCSHPFQFYYKRKYISIFIKWQLILVICLLSYIIGYDRMSLVSVDSMGIVPRLPFSETERGIIMDTLEVLTLLLVVFAALAYIDNHNNRK